MKIRGTIQFDDRPDLPTRRDAGTGRWISGNCLEWKRAWREKNREHLRRYQRLYMRRYRQRRA